MIHRHAKDAKVRGLKRKDAEVAERNAKGDMV